MIVILILIPSGVVYMAGGIVTFGRVASHIAWRDLPRTYRREPEWGEGIAFGLFNAAIWPLALPIWIVYWHMKSGVSGSFIFRPPAHLRDHAAKHENDRLQARIKELEREAGVNR